MGFCWHLFISLDRVVVRGWIWAHRSCHVLSTLIFKTWLRQSLKNISTELNAFARTQSLGLISMEPLQCFVCVVIKALTCAVVSAGLNFQHTSPTDVKPPLCAECNSLPYHLGCHRYCCFHSGTIVCTVQCFFFFSISVWTSTLVDIGSLTHNLSPWPLGCTAVSPSLCCDWGWHNGSGEVMAGEP